ncbi:FkbM family methyltransferase [Mesorhizobium sp. M0751]|uniref:FkbM family methyltransferase n=1 Tax=unclassified Mesorhizobium TaxID=325217 RepID=UPI00333CA0A2
MAIFKKVRSRVGGFRRPTTPTFRTVNVRGLTIVVPLHETVGWRLYWEGEYETELLDFFDAELSDGSFCVDIGANIGFISCYIWKKVGKTGAVISFEPDPLIATLAEFNLMLNGYDASMVAKVALSDSDGDAQFFRSDDSGYSGLRDTKRRIVNSKITVPQRRLDDFLFAKGQRAELIKVDVEGAEFAVMRGAKTVLADPELRPKIIVLETSEVNQKAFGYTSVDIVDFMRGFGYRAVVFGEKNKSGLSGNIVFRS